MFVRRLLLLLTGLLLVSGLSALLLTALVLRAAVGGQVARAADNGVRQLAARIDGAAREIDRYRAAALAARRRQLEDAAGLLVAHFDAHRALAAAGRLTDAEARQRAYAAAGTMRYGHDDYYFVYDRQGVNLAHADPAIRGRNMLGFRDVRGALATQQMLAVAAAADSGYLTFWFCRLGDSVPSEKLSCIRRYEPWQCVIGTGVYIDDIEREVAAYRAQLIASLRAELTGLGPGPHSRFVIIDRQGGVIAHAQGLTALARTDVRVAEAARAVHAGTVYRGPFDDGMTPVTVRGRHSAPADWYILAVLDDRDLDGPVHRALALQCALLLLATLAAILAALVLARRLTRPLPLLAAQAQALATGGFGALDGAAGACRELAAGRDDELGKLAQALATMTAALQRHVAELADATAARERMASELRIARDIQMAMLTPPAVPPGAPYELAAYLAPAREIGGDLYLCLPLADGRLLLAVGDVSGKGVPAALLMARTVTALRLLAAGDAAGDPPRLLARLNAELVRDNDQCHFVTLWCGVYTPATGVLAYAGAGHCLPLLREAAGGVRAGEQLRGGPLGLREQAVFTGTALTLPPGATLLVYTDGVTEAQNATGGFYGDERLGDWFAARPSGETATALVAALVAEVAAFAAGAPPADDLTTLALRRQPAGE